MNLDEIKKLIKLVEKSKIHELELEEEGHKVRVTKSAPQPEGGHQPIFMSGMPQAAPQAAPQPAAQASTPDTEPAHMPGKGEDESKKYHLIKSPIVGTFYRRPSPDADLFVDEGDLVGKGQTLCIIEAMKLMNEIESDVRGRIVEVVPEDGSPVEYGAVLFKVDPE